MMYDLTKQSSPASSLSSLKKLWMFLHDEKPSLAISMTAILMNAGLNLAAPLIIGRTIDRHIVTGDYAGVLQNGAVLFVLFLLALVSAYTQTSRMGGVGQRVLYKLRNAVFTKLQALPIAFFQQNKAGDLISRINNDTDKLNQFLSQSLMQFLGNIVFITGAAIFLLSINLKLGLAALVPAIIIVGITRVLSPWVRRKNAESLKTLGSLSAEIQQNLENIKVVIAFHRRDFVVKRLQEMNEHNYAAAVRTGIANMSFVPIYAAGSAVAQLVVLVYGIHLIQAGSLTVGLLISFFLFLTRLYDPLRQMAAIWTSYQSALAAWDRVSAILRLESDMTTQPSTNTGANTALVTFQDVGFSYPDGKQVLHDVNIQLEHGKTYAFVGPTGGGKTTTASLVARLFDPTQGSILLEGRDIRSYSDSERAKMIGFILQEPFLFTGTLADNILYSNEQLANTPEELQAVLEARGLSGLLTRFKEGLTTPVSAQGDSMSLGQKQIIAFIRAVLREPKLLILDEATANIDTVTEQALEEILAKLPASTTRIIIAHRLNTIENADEIFFVNRGTLTAAGSVEQALDMLLHQKRVS